MHEAVRQLARRLPFVVTLKQDLLPRVVPARFYQDRSMLHWLDFLEKSQHWSLDRQLAYRLARLQALLAYAQTHVPYYRTLFAEHGLRAADCKDIDYLRKIPTMDKSLVRANFDSLTSDVAPPDTDLFTTGGSTGEPLALKRERSYWSIEQAFIARAWSWVGFHPGDRILQMRGNVVDPARLQAGKTWQIDWRERVMRLSPYDLVERQLDSVLGAMARFKPRYIHAYPTAAMLLARILIQTGKQLPFEPKALLLGSEPVYPHQRRLLESTFGCRVFSHYGHAECVTLACETADSNDYHLMPEYGVTEVLRADGSLPEHAGERCEIVGTGFHARAFPLIRYRTDDWVNYRPAKTEDGAFTPLGHIFGRGQDVIVRKDGGLVSLGAFTYGRHLQAYKNILAMQLEQRQPGDVAFRIVRGPYFNDADVAELLAEFARNGREQIRIRLEYVDALEKTASGKQRLMIQHLPIDAQFVDVHAESDHD